MVKKQPFTLSKYRFFIYDSTSPENISVSQTHNPAITISYPLNKCAGTIIDLNGAPLAYNEKLPLKAAKYDSIMPIVRKYVPPICQKFYDTIKRADPDGEKHDDSD